MADEKKQQEKTETKQSTSSGASSKNSSIKTDAELKEMSQSRAKKRAEERLRQVDGGDLTRGLASKARSVDDKPSFEKVEQEVKTKAKEKASKAEPKVEPVTEVVTEEPKAKKSKKKNIGNIVVDESALGDMVVGTDTKARRKGLVIAIIVVLLVVVWLFIIVTRFITPQKPDYNCGMSLSGGASSNCTLLLNGEEKHNWITPDGISPRAQYSNLGIELSLSEGQTYDVKFRVEVKNDGKIVEDFGIVDTLAGFVRTLGSDGHYWYVYEDVEGGQKLNLITNITFYDPNTQPDIKGLTSDNIEMNIYVVVEFAD